MAKFELMRYMGITAVIALVMSIFAGKICNTLFPNLPDIVTIWYYAPRLAPPLGFIGTGIALSQNPNSPRTPLARCLLIGNIVGLLPGTFFTILFIT